MKCEFLCYNRLNILNIIPSAGYQINEAKIWEKIRGGGRGEIHFYISSLLPLAPVLVASNPERYGEEFCLGVPADTHTTHTHLSVKHLSVSFWQPATENRDRLFSFLIYFLDCDRDPKYQRICHFCETSLEEQVFKHLSPCITMRRRRHLAELKLIDRDSLQKFT